MYALTGSSSPSEHHISKTPPIEMANTTSKKPSTEVVEFLTDLPPNILLEILVRLPLKTLAACKCVCRTFRSLTSPNPHFLELHSSNAPQALIFQLGREFEPSRIVRLLEPELRGLEIKPIFQIPDYPRGRVVYRSNFREVNKYYLVNTCNGLLYFVRENTEDECPIVCNPITNEYKLVPGFDVKGSISVTRSLWLGFSRSTNQYKVLRIFGHEGDGHLGVRAQVHVVGSNSWENIGNTPLGSDHSWDTSATFLDGVVYYLDSSQKVVSFDFERETFGEIALPTGFGEDKGCMTIGVLGGCLSLSYNDSSAYRLNIWVMEKRGDQESWCIKFMVETMTSTGRPLYGQFKPLQILRNGELLMFWIGKDLVHYDPKNKSIRLDGLYRVGIHTKVDAFTPSFLPLKDALRVEKVIVQKVRPRRFQWERSEE